MDISLISAILLLFFVIDPIGNVPVFIATLEKVDPAKRARVVARECAIAYAALMAFLFGGQSFMGILRLTDDALGIAGGVILFIIALRMIFRRPDGIFGESSDGEPFIFPLAIPLFAGPSALATVLLLVSHAPDRTGEWVIAITVASALSTLVLSLGGRLSTILGKRGIHALETLVGLLLTAVAVQMLLDGIRNYIETLGFN